MVDHSDFRWVVYIEDPTYVVLTIIAHSAPPSSRDAQLVLVVARPHEHGRVVLESFDLKESNPRSSEHRWDLCALTQH